MQGSCRVKFCNAMEKLNVEIYQLTETSNTHQLLFVHVHESITFEIYNFPRYFQFTNRNKKNYSKCQIDFYCLRIFSLFNLLFNKI